ncbi:MAG: hypothetical protein C0523_03530 [Cytophaga sp.]|nr:hypothetical protein [Cytophaga sp.]
MLIKEHTLQHWLDHFYGFGSWDSAVWFVGYEEGGGDLPEEVAEKLDYFYSLQSNASQLCDLRNLYRHTTFQTDGPRANLFHTLYDYRFGEHAVLHGIWKNLIAFAHGYQGKVIPDLLTYQKKQFAISSEALIALYPLPSPHNHAWYYSWLDLPQKSILKTRKRYEEHIYPQRIQNILNKAQEHKPKVILLYGMNTINQLKRSIQEFFQGVEFRLVKGTKLEIPQHHRADLPGTTILITTQTPALKHNRAESGFDWAKLAREI